MVAILGWIGKGFYAAASLAGYGFRVSEEVKDSKVSELVRNKLSNCTTTCCITGWQEVIGSLRPVPKLSLVTSLVTPFATFGVGALVAHTFSNSCKIRCCLPAKKGEVPTTMQKVTLAARAAFALTTSVLIPVAAYFEKTDVAFIEKVSGVFSSCYTQNATACCLAGWEGLVQIQHDSPVLSLVSAVAIPAATFVLGVITYQDISLCCRKRSRVDKMAGSASYNPIPTDAEGEI